MADAYVSIIPFPIKVTFPEPITQNLTESLFTYVNCVVYSFVVVNPTLIFIQLVPLKRLDFTVSITAGSVTSSSGLSNAGASTTFRMLEAPLTTKLQLKLVGMIGVRVYYSYDALVYCTRTENDLVPSSCESLRNDTWARPRNITGGETILPLSGFDLGQVYYVWCCAEEPYGTHPTNSIQDTRLVVDVGWFDCPVTANGVCDGHGTCIQGESCSCYNGYYGADCSSSCPGVYPINATAAVECSNHGICSPASFSCQCEPTFQTPSCSLPLLSSESPSNDTQVFLYVSFLLEGLRTHSYAYGLLNQQETILSSLIQIFNVSYQEIGVRVWSTQSVIVYLELEKEVADQKLFDVRQSLFTAWLSHSLVNVEGITSAKVVNVFIVTTEQTDLYTCYDGIVNGDETDIDCGGEECSLRCLTSQKCVFDRDCKSSSCRNGVCKVTSWLEGHTWLLILIICLIVVIIGLVFCLVILCCYSPRKHQLPIRKLPLAGEGVKEVEKSAKGVKEIKNGKETKDDKEVEERTESPEQSTLTEPLDKVDSLKVSPVFSELVQTSEDQPSLASLGIVSKAPPTRNRAYSSGSASPSHHNVNECSHRDASPDHSRTLTLKLPSERTRSPSRDQTHPIGRNRILVPPERGSSPRREKVHSNARERPSNHLERPKERVSARERLGRSDPGNLREPRSSRNDKYSTGSIAQSAEKINPQSLSRRPERPVGHVSLAESLAAHPAESKPNSRDQLRPGLTRVKPKSEEASSKIAVPTVSSKPIVPLTKLNTHLDLVLCCHKTSAINRTVFLPFQISLYVLHHSKSPLEDIQENGISFNG